MRKEIIIVVIGNSLPAYIIAHFLAEKRTSHITVYIIERVNGPRIGIRTLCWSYGEFHPESKAFYSPEMMNSTQRLMDILGERNGSSGIFLASKEEHVTRLATKYDRVARSGRNLNFKSTILDETEVLGLFPNLPKEYFNSSFVTTLDEPINLGSIKRNLVIRDRYSVHQILADNLIVARNNEKAVVYADGMTIVPDVIIACDVDIQNYFAESLPVDDIVLAEIPQAIGRTDVHIPFFCNLDKEFTFIRLPTEEYNNLVIEGVPKLQEKDVDFSEQDEHHSVLNLLANLPPGLISGSAMKPGLILVPAKADGVSEGLTITSYTRDLRSFFPGLIIAFCPTNALAVVVAQEVCDVILEMERSLHVPHQVYDNENQ